MTGKYNYFFINVFKVNEVYKKKMKILSLSIFFSEVDLSHRLIILHKYDTCLLKL